MSIPLEDIADALERDPRISEEVRRAVAEAVYDGNAEEEVNEHFSLPFCDFFLSKSAVEVSRSSAVDGEIYAEIPYLVERDVNGEKRIHFAYGEFNLKDVLPLNLSGTPVEVGIVIADLNWEERAPDDYDVDNRIKIKRYLIPEKDRRKVKEMLAEREKNLTAVPFSLRDGILKKEIPTDKVPSVLLDGNTERDLKAYFVKTNAGFYLHLYDSQTNSVYTKELNSIEAEKFLTYVLPSKEHSKDPSNPPSFP